MCSNARVHKCCCAHIALVFTESDDARRDTTHDGETMKVRTFYADYAATAAAAAKDWLDVANQSLRSCTPCSSVRHRWNDDVTIARRFFWVEKAVRTRPEQRHHRHRHQHHNHGRSNNSSSMKRSILCTHTQYTTHDSSITAFLFGACGSDDDVDSC